MAPIAISPPNSPTTTTSTTHNSSSSPPSLSQYRGYDHIHWVVGNAKQAASYYITRFGFSRLAYRGLETGSRVLASHVVRNGDVTFVLTSPLRGLEAVENDARFSDEERETLREVHMHLEKHGDGVRDVAFEVDDVQAVYGAAVANGAVSISAPKTLRDKKGGDGEVKVAVLKTFGDTMHTLIERRNYRGVFMPGYRSDIEKVDPVTRFLPGVELEAVDHCVGNQDWEEMDGVCE
jgi:4-hydroxyphenylpyruvate dioxygenase